MNPSRLRFFPDIRKTVLYKAVIPILWLVNLKSKSLEDKKARLTFKTTQKEHQSAD